MERSHTKIEPRSWRNRRRHFESRGELSWTAFLFETRGYHNEKSTKKQIQADTLTKVTRGTSSSDVKRSGIPLFLYTCHALNSRIKQSRYAQDPFRQPSDQTVRFPPIKPWLPSQPTRIGETPCFVCQIDYLCYLLSYSIWMSNVPEVTELACSDGWRVQLESETLLHVQRLVGVLHLLRLLPIIKIGKTRTH